MINVAKALYNFWSGFNIPAFVENTVPDDVQMPYITYRLAQPDWLNPMSMYARIWYRGTSFLGIAGKVNEISKALECGKTIRFSDNSGYITLFKDSNFCQYMPDLTGDEMVKTAYLSVIMHAVEV